jgi:hypothetical protein
MTLRQLLAVIVVAGLVTPIHTVWAHGDHGRPTSEESSTRFDRFLVSCSPCVTEAHPIATIPVPALRVASFPRMAGASTARPGEVVLAIVRAYELGRPSRRALVLRMTLSVAMGTAGEMYRLGEGILDDHEVAPLGSTIGEMARFMSTAEAGANVENIDVHGGSIRVGLSRLHGETVAYVQAGEVHTFLSRPIWQVPNTLYLSNADLAALATAIGQAATKIEALRTR